MLPSFLAQMGVRCSRPSDPSSEPTASTSRSLASGWSLLSALPASSTHIHPGLSPMDFQVRASIQTAQIVSMTHDALPVRDPVPRKMSANVPT